MPFLGFFIKLEANETKVEARETWSGLPAIFGAFFKVFSHFWSFSRFSRFSRFAGNPGHGTFLADIGSKSILVVRYDEKP